MRFLLFLASFLTSQFLLAQVDVRVYYTETTDGFEIYIDNHEHAPVTVALEYEVLNLRLDVSDRRKVVVPANHKAYRAGRLRVINPRKAYRFSYSYETNLGDHEKSAYDRDYLYRLPFAEGKSVLVSQGYNGEFSHKDVLALDFNVPVGTPVHAARGGVVVTVTERHDRNCTSAKCMDFNNLIILRHSDGTFAEYVHLRKDGAFVDPGDTVVQGQLIGESGNTGFSDGPHLHFAVFQPKMEGRTYLPTRFMVEKYPAGTELKVGMTYR